MASMDRLGSWLQIVSNVGVVIGLVLVGVQVQQSNVLALSEAYQHRTDLRSEFHRSAAESPQVAGMMVKIREEGFEALTPIEQMQMLHHLNRLMLLVDNIRFQTDLGLIEETWNDAGTLDLYETFEEAGVSITPRLQRWRASLPE